MTTELLGLPYSPWTEKARWALDVRKVPYRYRVYAPLVGELGLRKKLGKWRGTVSVPVLTADDGRVIPDSAAIARWADTRGEGPALFPAQHAAEIERYIELSERGLAAGRGLSLLRMRENDEALREMVPKRLRKVLGPLAAPLGGFGIRRTLRKYGAAGRSYEHLAADASAVLDELRSSLSRQPQGGLHLVSDHLTFADIAMAQVLGFVHPAPFGVRLGRASRLSFTDEVLRARYADLVEWRDRLYEAHRPRD